VPRIRSLTWTADGELVTVGDDFLILCWREGEDARDLRTSGRLREDDGRVGGRMLMRSMMKIIVDDSPSDVYL
jgi:hypothetical protein